MQGGESEVQQSIRRLTGLFGQVLMELGTLMGASALGALPSGEMAQTGVGPGAFPAPAEPQSPRASVKPDAVRAAGEPARAPEEPMRVLEEPLGAPEEPARAPDGTAGALRERIERAVDASLAMLAATERTAGNGGEGFDATDAPSKRPAAQTPSAARTQPAAQAPPAAPTPPAALTPPAARTLPAAQTPPVEPLAGEATVARAMPPVPPPPDARILRPIWMRAGAPPFPSEEPTPTEVKTLAPDAAPDPAPDFAPNPAPHSGPPERAVGLPPATFKDSDLFLVCQAHQGRNLAIPWNWVTDTRLSARGTPEAFTLSNGVGERQVTVSAVVGIWTKSELEQWQQEVRWLSSLDALHPATGTDLALETQTPAMSSSMRAMADGASPRAMQRVAPAAAPAVGEAGPADPREVWVVSPSALARRFLMRHLEHSGLELHESCDLDDPLLPADLGGVGALFLDESLQAQWRDHPASRAGGPPLVLLTVDGALQVPGAGERSPRGAVLPRPFERSEVESVVGWLRSLWRDGGTAGDEHHGDEEDDTWLFADPFGSPES